MVAVRGDTWLKQWRLATYTRWGVALTQNECASACKISRARWSEIENGATCWDATARAIEKLTGIAAADFHKRTKFKPAKRKAGR